MDNERIDFSPLDPSRDELRWSRTIDSLVARAVSERRARLSVERQLLRWARPVLAMAAGLCIAAWTAGLIAGDRQAQVATVAPPALTLANWAANNEIPDPSDLVATLRGN
jgi:hypothetical protein